MTKLYLKKIIKAMFGSVLALICHLIVTQAAYYISYPTEEELVLGYDGIQHIVITGLISVLFYFFIIRILTLYNSALREAYLGSESRIRFIGFVFGNAEFWCDSAIFAFSVLVFDINKTYPLLSECCLNGENGFYAKLNMLATVLPIVMLIDIAARLSSARSWAKNEKKAKSGTNLYFTESELNTKNGGLFRTLGVLAMLNYLALYHSVPPQLANDGKFIPDYSSKRARNAVISLFITTTLCIMLGEFIYRLLMRVFFPISETVLLIIALTVVLFFSFKRIRALILRMRFIHKLKNICKSKKLKLSKLRAPYRSVFSDMQGENFCLTVNKKVYSCKIITCLSPGTPLILSGDGSGIRMSTVTFGGIRLYQRPHGFEFGYESNNAKILIINPSTKFAYSLLNGGLRELENGYKVGDHLVFTAGSFLRGLERDCLEHIAPPRKIGD